MTYLYGRVVMDSGEPPPEPVLVKMGCGGGSRPFAYTDSKGNFSSGLGGDSGLVFTDASVGRVGDGGFGRLNPAIRGSTSASASISSSCLQAELPGYRSDELQLQPVRGMGGIDVGLIVLHRLGGALGHTVSVTSLAAPKAARKSYQKGLGGLRRKAPKYKKSISHFEKAVEVYPKFAAAWSALGEARRGIEDEVGAREAFRRALEADPKYLRPYEPLIVMAVARRDWPVVESLGGEYLVFLPDSPVVRLFVASAALEQGKLDDAEKMAQTLVARKESKQWPLSYFILGLVHEKRTNFPKAAEQYGAYLNSSPNSMNAGEVQRKLHEWGALQVIEPQQSLIPGRDGQSGRPPAPSH